MSPFAWKGPSKIGQWQRRVVRQAGETDLTILVLSDTSDSNLVYALPATPNLATDENGEPLATLTVALSRQPRPDQDSIRDLVDHALFGFTLTLSLPDVLKGDR